MCRFFLLILILFFPFLSFAQSKSLDSLLSALSTATPSTYTAVFSGLEQTVEKMEYTPALKVADKILSISKQLPFKGPTASAYRCKAIVYNTHNNSVQAIQAAQEAYRIAQHYKLPIEE